MTSNDLIQSKLDELANKLQVSNALMVKKSDNLLTVAKTAGSGRDIFPEGISQELGSDKKLYCEKVIQTNNLLIVADARASDEWKGCVDEEHFNLVSYCGLPLHASDGSIFGTVCVLDKNSRQFSDEDVKLITQTRDEIAKQIQA